WDSETFYQEALRTGLTVADLSTAYWHMLAQDFAKVGPRDYGKLRQVNATGEAMPPQGLHAWRQAGLDKVRLFNTYGPTETTVTASHLDCQDYISGALEIPATMPIGRGLSGRAMYILDNALEPSPLGVIGELYIGGGLLAEGYHRRQTLTAERFIADPFSQEPGQRMYRTGDLARYQADGTIEYVGRIDHQVKIRGFRIELGEIESALQSSDVVRDAVVLAQESQGSKQLVAYVIPTDKTLVEADSEQQHAFRAQLKEQLQTALPEYMVPAHLLLLTAFPLTPNGKLDKKALPAVDASQLQQAYVAPVTELEQQLAVIWQDALGIEQVGLTDNFFELGGHSLLLTQVVSRVRQLLSVDIAMRVMFEARDLGHFAEKVSQSEGGLSDAIEPVSRDGKLALSYAQQRQWVLWQIEPDSSAYHMSSALRLTGALALDALQQSFDFLFARHEVLRTHFAQDDEGQLYQVINAHSTCKVVVEDIDLAGEDESVVLQRHLQALNDEVFDLGQGPLLRVKLLRLSADEHVLALVQHHVVSDEWSMQLMVNELVQAYGAFSQQQVPGLATLPIQYADYAIWQRARLSGDEGERQLSYWQDKLGSEHPVLELPTDYARPLQASYRGATETIDLASGLVEQLSALAQSSGTTLFTLLLASFQTLLHRYSGQDEIRVGTPIANRNRLETENLIGFFVNTQVLRADFGDDLTFNELLAQVKQTTLEAQDNQDLPFEQLVDALQVERSLSHSPLFQVMFNYLTDKGADKGAQLSTIDGLTVESVNWDSDTAQFDLSLDIEEHEAGISASFEYATDLFASATIKRLAGHWQQLLIGIVATPHERIGQLPLLNAPERHALLHDWNRLAIPSIAAITQYQYVHAQIASQADSQPDAVALIFANEQLTFGQLNSQVNALAWRLHAAGAKPGCLVGLAIERNIDMVVGLLAILKSGAGYVPLDPDYPQERLAYMMADSDITLLLTQRSVVNRLPVLGELATVFVDGDDSAKVSKDFAPVSVHPENLAYVIYTSGSTGKPKGVAMSHRALLEHTYVAIDYFELTRADRVLLFSSLNFDGFMEQLFPALCIGAGVVIRGDEVWDSETFYQEALRTGLTVADLSTAYWHMLAQDFAKVGPRDYGKLRQV
ncbi:MAG: AMP-binding protein, partial [Gammaproteobacteria bacterium]|nr:AMP-binding protein [Gammaproteobacteria bacterium]